MPDLLSEAVSAEVVRLLVARGWSGRLLALRAGMKTTAVGYKLAGKRGGFTVDELVVVADVLDTSVLMLLRRAGADT